MPLWIGLVGQARRLAVILQPTPGRSPHTWLGPMLPAGAAFDVELMLHPDMGPGGMLWRENGRWSSFESASAWGLERLDWPDVCHIARDPWGYWPYRGGALDVAYASTVRPS